MYHCLHARQLFSLLHGATHARQRPLCTGHAGCHPVGVWCAAGRRGLCAVHPAGVRSGLLCAEHADLVWDHRAACDARWHGVAQSARPRAGHVSQGRVRVRQHVRDVLGEPQRAAAVRCASVAASVCRHLSHCREAAAGEAAPGCGRQRPAAWVHLHLRQPEVCRLSTGDGRPVQRVHHGGGAWCWCSCQHLGHAGAAGPD